MFAAFVCLIAGRDKRNWISTLFVGKTEAVPINLPAIGKPNLFKLL